MSCHSRQDGAEDGDADSESGGCRFKTTLYSVSFFTGSKVQEQRLELQSLERMVVGKGPQRCTSYKECYPMWEIILQGFY